MGKGVTGMLNLEELKRDLENFIREMAVEFYLNVSGLKVESNNSSIYKKYMSLFKKGLITEVNDMRGHVKGEEEKKLRYISNCLTMEYLKNAMKSQLDEANTWESKKVLEVDGEKMAFRQANAKIRDEDDRIKRGRIYAAWSQAVDEYNPLLLKLVLGLREKSKELGYSNYVTLYSDIKGIDLRQLEIVTEKFIEETDSLYTREMERVVRERLGLGLSDVEPHDMYRFYRASEFDKYFTRDNLLPALRKTLANMGIELDKQKNIHIDLEDRPLKGPHSAYVGVKVPEDIRLVVMPLGGYRGYEHLFHEVGHALHCGSTDPSLDFIFRQFGDISLSEGYAYLFQNLVMNEEWLRRYLGMGEAKSYLDFQYLANKLLELREWGSCLSYELQLHTKGPDGMDVVYEAICKRANKLKVDKNHYLIEDHWLNSADVLRSQFFEAQLRAAFRGRFGEGWFENPKAGQFLRELWSMGGKYDAEEVVKMLGYEGIDPKYMIDEIRAYYSDLR